MTKIHTHAGERKRRLGQEVRVVSNRIRRRGGLTGYYTSRLIYDKQLLCDGSGISRRHKTTYDYRIEITGDYTK